MKLIIVMASRSKCLLSKRLYERIYFILTLYYIVMLHTTKNLLLISILLYTTIHFFITNSQKWLVFSFNQWRKIPRDPKCILRGPQIWALFKGISTTFENRFCLTKCYWNQGNVIRESIETHLFNTIRGLIICNYNQPL